MEPATYPTDADALAKTLGHTGYVCDRDLATVAWLGLRLGRPLLLEGEPGTGKTALAEALARNCHALRRHLRNWRGWH